MNGDAPIGYRGSVRYARDSMAIAGEPVLNQTAVEVRYRNGVVFLDKCGSLTLKLQHDLGPPFESSQIPTMEFGEIRSDAERLAVRYGIKALNVVHAWPPNFVRTEQITPGVWKVVADTLNVGAAVTRCGARFWWLWKVDSLEEGETRIANTALFGESEEWTDLFGAVQKRQWSAESALPKGGSVRAQMATTETQLVGGIPAADLAEIIPKYAVMLDLDYSFPGNEPFALHEKGFKDFLRSRWQDARRAATRVGELLREEP